MPARAATLRMVVPDAGAKASAKATAATVPEAARIAGFVRGFSLEATRPDAADLDSLRGVLPPGTAIYLTAVPGRSPAEQAETAALVRARGFEPVPHIAARGLESMAALDEALARLAAEAGVRRVLVIGGDRDRPQGPFASALEVIETGLLQRHGIAETGVSGYPQGHPRIPQDVLDRALAAKIATAADTGLSLHLVTQFAFEAPAVADWLQRLRAQGIDLPVRVGLAGPASLARLLRYAQRCGVRASAQALARQAGLVKHLLGTSAPDGVIRPLAAALARSSLAQGGLGEVAMHFYSFGGVAATARWGAAVAAGRIVLDRTDGFGVQPP